jgi:hypothetical protein
MPTAPFFENHIQNRTNNKTDETLKLKRCQRRKMTSQLGNPFLTALQQENKRNSSICSFQSALYDESSFDNHKIPLLRNERGPGLSPSSTLDFDELDMNIASASSSNSSSSANFGLEKCTLAKQQSNSSIGLPSSYPPFHSMDNSSETCGTYPGDLDDFEEFQLQLEKSRISDKPALHPLLFSELPKTVTPEKLRIPKSNQNRRRRNMALPSTTDIEQAVREELAMGPISIEGKLAL